MKKTSILIVCQFVFLSLISASTIAAKQLIFVIESYHTEYEWDASYKKGLESVLGERFETVYFQMDTKRIPATEYKKRADLAWDKYQQLNPALVILGDDNALKFLGTRFLATQTPVVYLGINNNPRVYLGDGYRQITGVMEKPLIKRTIPIINHIVGSKLKKVLILFDSGTTSKVSLSHVFKNKSNIRLGGVQADLKFISKLDDWQKAVISSKTAGYDALIIGLYHTLTDEKGNHVDADKVMYWTSKNAPIPPFGFWDFSVGPDKTIGGLVLFGEPQGVAAAQIALKILDRARDPKTIYPVIGDRGRYFFSRSNLKRFKLTLPKNIASKADFTD